VASALGRLSADQREAVVLKIYQGFKFDEMSEILECPGFHGEVQAVYRPRTAQSRTGSSKDTEVCHELLAIRFERLLPEGAG